jgi:hypothetical protein
MRLRQARETAKYKQTRRGGAHVGRRSQARDVRTWLTPTNQLQNAGSESVKISTVLDHIDGGHMALPEFQRGYVWNRDQVRSLFDSLYRRHPVGGLLVWTTESKSAAHRGYGPIASGVVNLLLDGQQRITSLYGVVRGRPPKFFDGNPLTFTGLRFHLQNETFAFAQALKMQGDPLWIDITELMRKGTAGAWGVHCTVEPGFCSGPQARRIRGTA